MEGAGPLIKLSVESVRINLATQQRVVILKALNQDRYLFIWIAHAEAYAIAVHLQGTISPRPLTHDLIKNLLERIGAKVVRVVITDLVEEIYYTDIVLDVAGEEVVVDARPSDAIALAVRTGTPIFVTEQVLERCGVQVESKDDASASSTEQKTLPLEQKSPPIEQVQIGGVTNSDTEVSSVPTLQERLAQVEEELRKAQARIVELEGK
jgi:bifunctional DNase/RNase